MMQISQVANAANLPVKTVRYYADIGLVKPAGRTASGYRAYDEAELGKLIFVRRAREFGFSIEECRELLGLYEDKNRSSADVKKLARVRLQMIEEKQRELQALHDELSRVVSACAGDNRPDCPILEHLG